MRPQNVLAASLIATAFAVPLSSAAYANIVISINKGTQRMLVSVDGVTRYQWRVSTGRAGYDTPSGVFKVNRMDPDHHSKEYDNAFMPDSMFFDLNGHAIHGFNDVPHLGMAVSHGCVRLSPANAATLYALVKDEGMANTTVEINGHIPSRGAPLVASRQAPGQEAAYEPPPSYGQPAYYPPQGYGQQPYGPRGYSYGQQPAPYPQQSAPQQSYAQRSYGGSAFPPQPAPPSYGGQGYYQQSYQGQGQGYYDQPSYQQPRGLFSSPY